MALSLLKSEKGIRFAGRLLCDRVSQRPVVYTENAFIKFHPRLSIKRCKAKLREFGLKPKRRIEYGVKSWFVAFPENTGRDLFDACLEIGNCEEVVHCYPEIVRTVEPRSFTVFPQQWHL